jgi:hypothetical protein
VSAWSYGGSILSFAFPMILFLTVATSLYVTFTKPTVIPGHREQTVARPTGFTPAVRLPGHDQKTTGHAPAAGPQLAVAPGSEATATGVGENAGPEDPANRPDRPWGTGPQNPEGAE